MLQHFWMCALILCHSDHLSYVCMSSLPYFRRNQFETFHLTHLILALLGFIFAFLHMPGKIIWWIATCVPRNESRDNTSDYVHWYTCFCTYHISSLAIARYAAPSWALYIFDLCLRIYRAHRWSGMAELTPLDGNITRVTVYMKKDQKLEFEAGECKMMGCHVWWLHV